MMEAIERIRFDCLNDISRANIIYTCLLVATATSAADSLTFFDLAFLLARLKMSFANASRHLFAGSVSASAAAAAASSSLLGLDDYAAGAGEGELAPGGSPSGGSAAAAVAKRPHLLARMSARLGQYLEQLAAYLAAQFSEHTAASVASCSVLIIVLSIICCFILSLWREEERRIKEQYMRLGTGSSQSFIAIDGRRACRPHAGGGGGPTGQRAANMSLGAASQHQKGKPPFAGGLFRAHTFASIGGSCNRNGASAGTGGGGGGGGGESARYQKIIDQRSSVDSGQTVAGDEGPSGAEPSSSSSVCSSARLLHNDNHEFRQPDGPHRAQGQNQHQQNQHNHHQQLQQHHHNHNNHQYQHLHQRHHDQAGRSGDKLRLHELRRETYFGLVRLSRPGCRTVVLLCDAESRAELLRRFHQCVYPYRKNKTLQFAFLLIERNIGWYEDLLKSVLSERCPESFRINPINCIGTVLVLNGFKKFFSVYHASSSRWGSPASDEEPPSLLLVETLLDTLPEWLERVFSGKVNRYYVESWPARVQNLY